MLIASTEAVVYIASHGDVGCLTIHRPLELGIFVLDKFQASTIELGIFQANTLKLAMLLPGNFLPSTLKLSLLLLGNFEANTIKIVTFLLGKFLSNTPSLSPFLSGTSASCFSGNSRPTLSSSAVDRELGSGTL